MAVDARLRLVPDGTCPVKRHRCPTCGGAYAAWTPDLLTEAARAWAAEHGRNPYPNDWFTSGPHHPAKGSVYRCFKSWPAFIEAAGLPPTRKRWKREEILHALLKYRFETGRLPRDDDWMEATAEHPSRHAVRYHFGTWNGMIVAGGYEPLKPRRPRESYRALAGAATKRAASRD